MLKKYLINFKIRKNLNTTTYAKCNKTYLKPSIMKKILTTFFLLLTGYIVFSQQVTSYLIGEEELSGVHIYSIIQDRDANIWLTSNNGLFRYDGYQYHSYISPKMENKSLFQLRMDNNGKLFCCNLLGQIFKIENDSLILHYQIPDSLISSNAINFNFDNQNNLIFSAKSYYILHENKEIELILNSNNISYHIPKNDNNELLLFNSRKKNFYYYKNKILTKKSNNNLSEKFSQEIPYHNIYIVNRKMYLHSPGTPQLYSYNSGNWKQINFKNSDNLDNKRFDVYTLSDSTFWLISNKNGAYVYKNTGETLYAGIRLFPRHRISCFLEDREGNLWLPTLGKGINIIPNRSFIDFTNHLLLKDDDIKAITADNDGNIYLSGANGLVYHVKNDKIEVIKKHNFKIEFMEYIDYDNSLFFRTEKTFLNPRKIADIEYEQSAKKDLFKIDKYNYLVATNNGVMLYAFNTDYYSVYEKIVLFKDTKKNSENILDITEGRTNCTAYDKINNEIWAGTSTGLKIIKKHNREYILFNNKKIIATDIEIIDNQVWVSTTKNGILVFQNSKFVKNITTENKLISNEIGKITYKNSLLYISSRNGFQIYDIENDTFTNILKSDGLLSHHIIDFEVVGDVIWFILSNGVQKIDVNKLNKNKAKPIIELTSFFVNEQEYPLLEYGKFTYKQNRIELNFIAKAFRHRGSLIFEYQLEGLFDDWQTLTFSNNNVKFSSLPPGNYIFNVRAINENGIISDTASYSFSISRPFWQKWWFFTLFTIIGAGSTILFFTVRIRRIKHRTNLEKQLKSSEITAIKAQMNPHFIFNALNSVQDLIMLKDIRSSNIYLGKFADLMRKTLEISSHDFIPLSQEIELLHLYLDLEKLRFGEDFIYSIKNNTKDVEAEKLQIPVMLLQPYVENAVKHGLLHKKGKKHLDINFSIKDNFLVCEIIDNGVGRKKSAEINLRRTKYKSFATEANKKRIDLINETYSQKIILNTIDLFDNDMPIGTKVIFKFQIFD